jgi:hypothetical protein
MFWGTTPTPIRNYLGRELRLRKPTRVFEPFAGNFVIAQIVGSIDRSIPVTSSDVSLYSVAIGLGLTGQDKGIRLKPEYGVMYPAFANQTDPLSIAALVIIFSELATCRAKMGRIRYYAQLEKDIRVRAGDYIQQVRAKVAAAKAMLGAFTFYGQDAAETLQLVQPGDTVFFDPPYEALSYEKEYGRLTDYFDWEQPRFTEFSDEVKAKWLQDLTERKATVYYRPPKAVSIPGYEEVFRYEYKNDFTEQNLWRLYCNADALKAQGRASLLHEEGRRWDTVFEDTVLTRDTVVRVAEIPAAAANHYRVLWTKKVSPRQAEYSFGVFLDGKIAGVIGLLSGQQFGSKFSCIMADAAPWYTRYRRLSKLVLYLILTEQLLRTLNDRTMHEHTGYTTMAYTDRPVSMKYRGLFDLAERKVGDDGKPCLVYRAEKMRWPTFADAYKAWFDQHGAEIKEPLAATATGTGDTQ